MTQNNWKLTDEQLIQLGREVVQWSMPQPPMAEFKEALTAIHERMNLYGRFVGFADGVSDIVYGGECAWCKDEDHGKDGLRRMIEELRKRK
jgi:hypothetical protein